MSATIFYKQVKPKDRRSLGVGAPSSFIEAMTRAFGNAPWCLGAEHIPILKGMAAVHGREGWDENPFERLIQAVEKLDVIEVWPEW